MKFSVDAEGRIHVATAEFERVMVTIRNTPDPGVSAALRDDTQ